VALLAFVLLAPAVSFADSVRVKNGNDAGRGSFRAAVETANANQNINKIEFRKRVRVRLLSDVVYTGSQKLKLVGRGSRITAAPTAPVAATWDGGLFVSKGGADLNIRDLQFRDSFNSGIGIFIPESQEGTVTIELKDVSVRNSRFHGVFVDGQSYDGFNTDDIPHPDCVDPHPFDSDSSIFVELEETDILNNGTLRGGFNLGVDEDGTEVYLIEPGSDPDYPDGALAGCPADFDGLRVDDGGPGGITGLIEESRFNGNLADGIEFDDTGAGSVVIYVVDSEINENGETGTGDLDDGLDLDEAGPGNLIATLNGVDILNNRDEGLDFDEAGDGSAAVFLSAVNASGNEDQGLKVDEEDAGNLSVSVSLAVINDSLSQNGIELTEELEGDLVATFADVIVNGNDDWALEAEQQTFGDDIGRVEFLESDLTGNGDPSVTVDPSEITVTFSDTVFDPAP